jgi:hypothetical protein
MGDARRAVRQLAEADPPCNVALDKKTASASRTMCASLWKKPTTRRREADKNKQDIARDYVSEAFR